MLQVNSKKGALSSQENLIKAFFWKTSTQNMQYYFDLKKKVEQFFNLIVVMNFIYIYQSPKYFSSDYTRKCIWIKEVLLETFQLIW